MKAVVVENHNLVLRDVEKPVPTEDQVLIRIVAVSVNAYDYRSMQLGFIPKRRILGADIAGVVESVGTRISQFKISDEVFGDLSSCGSGGFAEYVAVPERFLASKPSGVSFEDAAAVPMASLTALQGLRLAKIKPGQKVLICGAGGGVGTFAVQLAKFFTTEVTAICGPNNVALISSLGAGRVIDYTKEDFAASGQQYDLILAVNGSRSLSTYQRSLAPGGNYVLLGGSYSQIFSSLVFGPLLSIGSKKMRFLAAKPDVKDLAFVIDLVQQGKIKPVIDKRYPLEETANAVRYLSEGHARGKVVINVLQK